MSNDVKSQLKAALALVNQLRAEKSKGEIKETINVNGRHITLKVSDKGGMAVYGLGRFPITLYRDQWLMLLEVVGNMEDFLNTHESKFSKKEDKDKSSEAA